MAAAARRWLSAANASWSARDDVVARGHFLGGDAHVAGVHRAGEPLGDHRIDDLAVAHPVAPARPLQDVRRVGHRFGAAGDHRVDVADANRFDGVHDRLQAGAADAIDGFARHLDRQPGLEPRLPGDVHADAGLEHATHHDVADVGGLHVRPGDRLSNHHGAEIDRRDVLQRAAERSDRRPAGAENHRIERAIQRSPPVQAR